MGRVVLALLFLIAVTGIAASDRNKYARVAGHYHSNWDDVTLEQKGDRVTGTYVCCGGGTIEGRIIENRIIKYVWKQPTASGRGIWTIGPGKLDGTWGSTDDSSGGRWDLWIDTQVAIAQ